MLRSKLTVLLGCKYPIVQTAMGWVSDSRLTAATCNAGGFGFLAGATIPPDDIESVIEETRQLTRNNFGINFHMYQPNASDIVDLVIKHRVKAVSYSRSPIKTMVGRLKEAGVVCMPTVGLPKHALKAIQMGADAVTVQGAEGGGHTGAVPTSLLIPQVVDAVNGAVPVAAAGGFKDGRGLVAALAWGADGVAMGTRFLLSKESPVPNVTKQYYLNCQKPSEILISRAIDGLPQRMIPNSLLHSLEKAGAFKKLLIAIINGYKYRKLTDTSVWNLLKSAMSMSSSDDLSIAETIMSANAPMIIQKAMVDGDPEKGILPSGQVAGVIDQLLSCDDIISCIVEEANERLQVLAGYQPSSKRKSYV